MADIGIKKGDTFETIKTLAQACFMVWIRMLLHYVGQYAFLKIYDAPVESLSFKWYKLVVVYTYWNLETEVLTIIMGTLMNTFVFCFLIAIVYLSQKYIYCFPPVLCKLIAWYGFATCLDFFLILIVDMAIQDDNGDMFKLYNYFQKQDNGGMFGIFITFLAEAVLVVLNTFIFYEYIVFVHNDARISDIYLRISGLGRGYYIPADNEISWNYLKMTYHLAEINANRILVNTISIPDPFTTAKPLVCKAYQF